jgi:hypothetical protein
MSEKSLFWWEELARFWRFIRGRCEICGSKETLPLPRTYRATGIHISSGWCRKHHPRWQNVK